MDSNANASQKYWIIAVILLMLVPFGLLGSYALYNHYKKDPQVASKAAISTLTPAQEVHGVIRQITTCLTDEKAMVGKPLKHIDNVSTQTEKGGYLIASLDGISYFNASGDYMRRALHCQKSVK
ncbi:hypothetical protein HYT05_03790 [Candidatus Kaiserbacteria bacterium]|nr:hypothetical protein [Candidatus Kaiserbacteria bacterium]